VALVSGGFDSAVASWLMLKRGVQLDYVFCNLGGTAHRLGVLKVMKHIATQWSHGYSPRLHEVDLAPLIAELRDKVQPHHWQIVLKRIILRAGAAVAHRGGRLALITGDAIGQVSSQTLQNLAVISQASPAIQVLRPLLGFNKEEILEVARRIGVHDLAAVVAEYCDLNPPKPTTRAALKDVLRDEAHLDPDRIGRQVDERQIFDLGQVDPEAVAAPVPEVDCLPPGATLLDLRQKPAFQSWHYPGALHLNLPQALAAYRSFARDRPYVLVCEVGLKSAHLAEQMKEAGFEAYQLKGGLKGLMELAERERKADLSLLAPALIGGVTRTPSVTTKMLCAQPSDTRPLSLSMSASS